MVDKKDNFFSNEEELNKGALKDAIKVGIAASMLSMPNKLKDPPQPVSTPKPHIVIGQEANTTDSAQKLSPRIQHNIEINPFLKTIAMIESSGGKNTEHKEIKTGMHAGNAAIGRYGLMPSTVVDIAKKSDRIKKYYPELASFDHKKDGKTIKDIVSSDPNLENLIALELQNRLSKVFGGDHEKMAYAWFNGVTGTHQALKSGGDSAIKNHFYVKNFNKYKNQIENKLADTPLKKSEIPNLAYHIVEFVPKLYSGISQDDLNFIKECIDKKDFGPVPSPGKFSDRMFVVCPNDPKRSWVFKLESNKRQYGTAPILNDSVSGPLKEYAFYALSKIFGLSAFVPYAIYGDAKFSDGSQESAVLIKMLGNGYRLATDYESDHPGSMPKILDKYLRSGLLHKLLAMIYILGDADSHARNVMTDGFFIKLIDHAAAFKEGVFSTSIDKKIIKPYIMRVYGSEAEDGPKIPDENVREELRQWISSLSGINLASELEKFNIDPKDVMERFEAVKNAVLKSKRPDLAINALWVL